MCHHDQTNMRMQTSFQAATLTTSPTTVLKISNTHRKPDKHLTGHKDKDSHAGSKSLEQMGSQRSPILINIRSSCCCRHAHLDQLGLIWCVAATLFLSSPRRSHAAGVSATPWRDAPFPSESTHTQRHADTHSYTLKISIHLLLIVTESGGGAYPSYLQETGMLRKILICCFSQYVAYSQFVV